MSRWPAVGVACALALVPPGVAQAADDGFAAAFAAAQLNDANHRVARYELAAREEAVPIARATLLPSLSASYAESRVQGDRESPNALAQLFTQRLDYRSPVASLQLRAPVVNVEAWRRLDVARSQVDAARAGFQVREIELLDRLAVAYVEALLAAENVALARAQVEALDSQALLAERRWRGGEGTRVEAAEAAAGLEVARVVLQQARDQSALTEQALRRVVGAAPLRMRALPEPGPALALPSIELAEWERRARDASPLLRARQQEVESARREVARIRAGHLPRLDLVASAADSRNETVSTLNQTTRLVSAGVQLTIPLYSGGAVEASVRQALAQLEQAQAQFDATALQLALDLRRQHQLVFVGDRRIIALRQTLAASELALEGAQRSLRAGRATGTDVLDALRRVFEARRDLLQTRHEVLLGRMRLQALAGVPVPEVVGDLDRLLAGDGVPLPEGPR